MYLQHTAAAERVSSLPTMAPVMRDDEQRDHMVSVMEKSARKHIFGDYLSSRLLAEQYLQRYRERGDIGDALSRGEALTGSTVGRH